MSTQAFALIEASKHWDEQVACLEQVTISETTARLMNCPKHATIIKQLLSNPRSKVITTVTQFLVELIDKYGPVMHPFVNGLIGTEVLWKLVNSSNKVVFMSVNELMKAIVMHCGNSKFWGVFSEQMSSKNGQVRQVISGYMLVLADSIQIPSNYMAIIRKWKTDANKVVRENAAKLEDCVGSQKLFRGSRVSINNKQNMPDLKKIKKQRSTKAQHTKQQIIVESFISNSYSEQNSESKNYDSGAVKQDVIENIEFLLSKIVAQDDTWSMKLYAIEEICQIYQDKIHIIEENVALKIIGLFVGLLDQRRSRINMLMGHMLVKVIKRDSTLFSKFIQVNFGYFAEQAGKNEEQGPQVISMAVDTNPQKFVMQLAQSTVDIKSMKQKIMLFDVLVQKICQHSIRASKVPQLVKLMCKHIEKYSQAKQIYLPCLAVMSTIKSTHSDQFLTCMLSQQKKVLAKFLEVAELVDPSLREAVLAYLHSLKASGEKDKKDIPHEDQRQQSELRTLIEQVANDDEEECVAKLVEYVFDAQDAVTVRQFYQIIKLTERVASKSSLVELELLLEQICKTQNQKFIQALFQAMADCNSSTIQSEYILSYLCKVHLMLTKCSWLMNSKYAQKLVSLYRLSKCPKIRLMAVKTLSHFPTDLIASHVNSKEKALIESQQKLENLSHPAYR